MYFKRTDFNKRCKLVGEISSETSWSDKRVQKSWQFFKEMTVRAQSEAMPTWTKDRKCNQKTIWLNHELFNDLELNKMYRKWNYIEIVKTNVNEWHKYVGKNSERQRYKKKGNLQRKQKLSVSTFAVKRTLGENGGLLLKGENKFLPDESQKS